MAGITTVLRHGAVWLITLGLMAWVVVLAWPTLSDAMASAELLSWWWLAGVVLVGMNLVLAGALWYLLHLPLSADRPITFRGMTCLLVGSALMNMVPGPRWGLLGRSIYLKKVHGITIRDSTLALGWVLAVSALIFPLACLPLVSGLWVGFGVWAVMVVVLAWPVASIMRRWFATVTGGGVLVVFAVRSVDVVAQAARLMVAGQLLGFDISLGAALAMGVIGLLTRLASLTPNGLGLTEVALAASAMWLGEIEPEQMASVSLVDRAIETAVVMISGGVCLLLLRAAWSEGVAVSDSADRDST
ncbi:lysylphosphatidylglycerol synthase domain-containing protein [Mucisphaera calidilacus]|uniref:Uncharacterized protein n=1 Tax=Mucisphaera calidilacus TaxID=2527982 RepID=A0A518BY28_9BACT|nr:lysylphosphatidylglycerol synthase domain-containing protein [Mucisphaera calidilacus]QDU71889.1 hypothetical protein Pan265_17480 [Mucisphaera calidilacus]